jgi:F0F1-type ATP synthase assembly protein I
VTPPSQPPLRSKVIGQLAPLFSLGLELAMTVLVGGALGWIADRESGMSPLWTIVGFVFGITAAIIHFVRTIKRLAPQHRSAPNSAQPPHSAER